MHDTQAERVDEVDVCTVIFEDAGDGEVGLKNGIMQTGKSLAVLEVNPVPLALSVVLFGLQLGPPIVLAEEELDDVLVVIIAGEVQHCRRVFVDHVGERSVRVEAQELFQAREVIQSQDREYVLLSRHITLAILIFGLLATAILPILFQHNSPPYGDYSQQLISVQPRGTRVQTTSK